MFGGILPGHHNTPVAAHPVLAFAENAELLAHPFGFGVILGRIGEVEAIRGHAESRRQLDRGGSDFGRIGGIGLRCVVDQAERAIDDAMQIDFIEITRDIAAIAHRCCFDCGSQVGDELHIVPRSATLHTNGVLHGRGQQGTMESVQSVAIAKPRQGVGDARGVQADRASLGIGGWGFACALRSVTSGKGGKVTSDTAPCRQPVRTGSGSLPPAIFGSAT